MKPEVTVAVLTFNGERYIRRVIESVLGQEGPSFELLIVDSGSSDSTLDIVKDYPTVRLHEIPNTEFGHGRTRNLAADLARGTYIAYLTHDAVPTSNTWLTELIAPFELNPKVVAVLGKQIPRYNSIPLVKYDIEGTFASQGPDHGVVISKKRMYPLGLQLGSVASFYSDVNSATRVEFVRKVVCYQDVQYAEDQLFAKDIFDAGYLKAYVPLAAVEHSNDLKLKEIGPRTFDEIVGLRRIGTEVPQITLFSAILHAIKGALRQTLQIARDRRFSLRRRLFWVVTNPMFHLYKWTAYSKATRVDLADDVAMEKLSLEHGRRVQAG